MSNLGMFGQIRSIGDYQRAEQEYNMKNQLMQAQIQKAQFDASPEGRRTSSTAPSSIQVFNKLQELRAAGDKRGFNELSWLARSGAYGIDTAGAMGGFPQEQLSPMEQGGLPAPLPPYGVGGKPSLAQQEVDSIPADEMAAADAGMPIPNQTPIPSFVPNQTPMPSVFQQQASGAALKKGAEQQAQKNVDLQMNPKIEAATLMEKTLAEDRAKAKIALAGTEANVTESLSILDNIQSSKGFEATVGVRNPAGGALPFGYNLGGSPAADTQTKIDQLVGKNFLAAFQSLKGGGAITEMEGKKATDAMARLNTSQSEVEYRKSLDELRGVLKLGLERARNKANGAASDATYRAGEAEFNAGNEGIQNRASTYKSKYGLE